MFGTRTQFRGLLLGYLIIVILNALSDTWTPSVVPNSVTELAPTLSPTGFSLLWLFKGLFLFATLLAGLVGFIGMLCFWSAARYIYLIAVFLKILAMFLMVSWIVRTNWESFLGDLELFLDGVILTLCCLGPAKHLFEKEKVLS